MRIIQFKHVTKEYKLGQLKLVPERHSTQLKTSSVNPWQLVVCLIPQDWVNAQNNEKLVA